MKTYKCHKIVDAAKIAKITPAQSEEKIHLITFESGSELLVSDVFITKHAPEIGGYFVIYEDGYSSYSPAQAFEDGYRAIDSLTFGDAIEALKDGKRIARAGWNGKGMWLLMQTPDEHSKMTLPYIYIEYPEGHSAYQNGSRVPWFASQADMMAEDWTIIE